MRREPFEEAFPLVIWRVILSYLHKTSLDRKSLKFISYSAGVAAKGMFLAYSALGTAELIHRCGQPTNQRGNQQDGERVQYTKKHRSQITDHRGGLAVMIRGHGRIRT